MVGGRKQGEEVRKQLVPSSYRRPPRLTLAFTPIQSIIFLNSYNCVGELAPAMVANRFLPVLWLLCQGFL